MTDQSPAETLRAAAEELRTAATDARHDLDNLQYWQGVTRLPNGGRWERGITNALGGAAGAYCAMLGPAVGLAVADWLESLTGVEIDEHGPLAEEYRHGLAVARTILGGVS